MNYVYNDQLESERMLTHKLQSSDAAEWSSFFEDPECTRFLPQTINSTGIEQAKYWIERQQARYENKTFGLQKLTDKRNGEFIGLCGLLLQDVEGVKELEIGYHLFKKHWGKGYATEAARLFRDHAFKNKLSASVISLIHVDNLRSQRVAMNNGMQPEKKISWNGLDASIYRIKAPVL